MTLRASALSFLFQRLKWPVPMVRWRAAKEIRNLLNDPATRSTATAGLLEYLGQCKTESEVCEVLTIVFLTAPHARPTQKVVASCIHCPSILADMILERSYGSGAGTSGWRKAHSGRVPMGFKAGSYFENNRNSHSPPVLASNLSKLERKSGYPFLEQWAYEWKTLRDQQDTRCTGYPHYFDDVLEARSGVMGQYWQRIRDIYLSAYLRTMSYAVSEWLMPQDLAAEYCVDIVHGLAGLFEVEPTGRPEWLSDFPEQFCAPGADFATLTGKLLRAARAEGMRLVSLSTPMASSVQKYGRLALSSHFVTADYKPPNDALLYEKVLLMPILETFELKGSPENVTINEARMQGASGNEVAVCGCLYPIPVGAWHGDYFSMGISVPAPYTVPKVEVRCGNSSIECVAASGEGVSSTWTWNDDWVPPFPKGSTTRCGTATMVDDEVLAEAAERLERKLAFFVQVRIWDREGDYQDYSESVRTCYLPDQP